MIFNRLQKSPIRDYGYLSIFLLYIPLLFLGFGTDSDTYTVLNAWNHFLLTKDYVPSRLPGYVPHEIVVYFFTKLGNGGSVLPNLVSLIFAVLLCVFYIKVAKTVSIPSASVLLLILNPIFIVNSTTTIDYLWALCFFMIGFYLLLKHQTIWACLAFAFSSAFRLTYGVLVLSVFLYFFFCSIKENRKEIWIYLCGGLVILAVNFAAYYFPLDFAHWKLSVFLQGSIGDSSMWSPMMRVGRWGYKNLLFWGIPSVFVLLGLLISKVKKWNTIWNPAHCGIMRISLILIILVELMFFKYPIEVEYLLPLLPFACLIMGNLYKENRWVIPILSVLIFINGFFAISIAQPNIPNHATSAEFGITPSEGYLLSDMKSRLPFEANYHKTKNWWYEVRVNAENEK